MWLIVSVLKHTDVRKYSRNTRQTHAHTPTRDYQVIMFLPGVKTVGAVWGSLPHGYGPLIPGFAERGFGKSPQRVCAAASVARQTRTTTKRLSRTMSRERLETRGHYATLVSSRMETQPAVNHITKYALKQHGYRAEQRFRWGGQLSCSELHQNKRKQL